MQLRLAFCCPIILSATLKSGCCRAQTSAVARLPADPTVASMACEPSLNVGLELAAENYQTDVTVEENYSLAAASRSSTITWLKCRVHLLGNDNKTCLAKLTTAVASGDPRLL